MKVPFEIPVYDNDGNIISFDEKILNAIRIQPQSKIFIDQIGNQVQARAVLYFPPDQIISKNWKVRFDNESHPILELYLAPDADENLDHIQVMI